MSASPRFPHAQFVALIRDALVQAGMPLEIASVEAELAVEADLLGVPSHGVTRVPGLLKALHEGRATADPQIRTVRDKAAICVLDGDHGPGRYVCLKSM